jgi:nucleoside-diphosphate kinase
MAREEALVLRDIASLTDDQRIVPMEARALGIFQQENIRVPKGKCLFSCLYFLVRYNLTIMKHAKKERTLVLIKPDGIQRNLIGEIVQRYERVGLKLVGIKMTIPTEDMIDVHYTIDPEWKKKTGEKNIRAYIDKGLTPPHDDPMVHANVILEKLKKYLTSGPVIATVWEGAHAVAVVRKITGSTEPLLSAPGTSSMHRAL